MTWWQFLDAHPLLSGVILVAFPLALIGIMRVIAASIPAARYGVYAGRTVTDLDRVWFTVTALAVMCVPVFVMAVL